MALEDIIELIIKKTGLPREEIMQKIEEKYEELSGLVTKEGAAYIVARSFGVELPSAVRGLQMKNILPGMRNLNVVGRVFRISPINEFVRFDGQPGKVVNLYIGDNTYYVKVPLWNDQTSIVSEGLIKVGDVVQLVNGMARESIFGDVEIVLGRYGSIRTLEGDFDIPSAQELEKRFFGNSVKRVRIAEAAPGKCEIKGIIVQVFKGKYIFDICPVCGSTLENNKCSEHGPVEALHALVLSTVIDDGSGNIRAVFFRNTAERLIEMSAEEIFKLELEKRHELVQKILGRELVLTGRIRKNTRFDRLEFFVDDFKDLNVLEECKRLLSTEGGV
jgi:replication factor A1